jgi:hypothetical protein
MIHDSILILILLSEIETGNSPKPMESMRKTLIIGYSKCSWLRHGNKIVSGVNKLRHNLV